MMKGISPIIATILLIIMTVGIAALMYTWMSGMMNQLTTQTSQQIIQQTAIDFKLTQVGVNSASGAFIVTITNTGSATIDTTRVGVLAYVTVYSKLNPGTPNGTFQCSISNFTLSPGQVTQQTITCSNLANNIDFTRNYYVVKVVIGSVDREIVFS